MEQKRKSTIANVVRFPRLDVDTKQDKLDEVIVKIFPFFVAACVILAAIITVVFMEDYKLSSILIAICISFVLGFVIIGVVPLLLSDEGYYNYKILIPIVVIVPLVIGLAVHYLELSSVSGDFIVKFFDLFSNNDSWVSTVVSSYTITLMVFFCAFGVVSVIVAYFRSYLYRILRVLEKDPDDPKTKKAKKFLMVPDIIDVQAVELDPIDENGKFNIEIFRNTAFSLFMLGLFVCSYIFLNPFFLSEIPTEEMLFIAILLSLFLSPLVIPWSIVKAIGAKVKSQAPRDYYIWVGLKSRLYQGFFAFAMIMMLLLMSFYLGMDFGSIAITYLGYIIFMAIISIITAFVYVNKFYIGFKNGLMKSFLASQKREHDKKEGNQN